MHSFYDTIVVGGGPAGCAAAAFLARYKKRVLLIDKGISFGFLASLHNVQYFPGILENITGKEIVERLRKQAELSGADFKSGRVTKQKNETDCIAAFLGETEKIKAKSLIIATGASERTNYLPGEMEFLGKGVFHEVTRDVPIFQNRSVVLVGRNEESARAAMLLMKYVNKLYYVVPSNRLDIDRNIFGDIQRSPKIELLFSSSLRNINGTDSVTSVNIMNVGEEKELKVTAVFNYLHEFKPSTDFVEGEIKLSDKKTVMVDDELSTSHAGCFACGDVLCGIPQEPAITIAQGLLAAQSANKFLQVQ